MSHYVSGILPSRVVLPYAGATAPTGWLLCNGAAISRTTFNGLFTAIGSSHGSGDGSTTFNVPDYRGRFMRGVDGGIGRDPDRASRTASGSGGAIGDNVGSSQADDYKNHVHPNRCDRGSPNGSAVSSFLTATNTANSSPGNQDSGAPSTIVNGNETRPTNVNVTYIIKI